MKIDDYLNDLLCEIEEPEDEIMESGKIGNNDYEIIKECWSFNLFFVLRINKDENDLFKSEHLEEVKTFLETLKYYEETYNV